MPDSRTPETYEEWKEGMKALASNPNVAAKISGLGMIDHNWTVDSLRPYVIGTIESISPPHRSHNTKYFLSQKYKYRTINSH